MRKLLFGTALAAVLSWSFAVAAAAPIQVLLVDGDNNHAAWPETTKLMKKVLETIPDPVFVRTEERDLVLTNEAGRQFESATGYDTEPIVQHAGRILQTTAGATVAQDSLPVAGLEPGRYTLSATLKPGGAKPFARGFTVASP